MIDDTTAEQPLISVIVTSYAPAGTFAISCVVMPFDHEYEYEDAGVTERSILPLLMPHVVPCGIAVPCGPLPLSTVMLSSAVQLPPFETVTEYVPGFETVIDDVDAPLLQVKLVY